MQRRSSFSHLKSVESYCFHENKWTQLPDMLVGKCSHSTVTIGNKMFVIAGYFNDGYEVFDSITNKFTFIKENQFLKSNFFVSPKTIAITVGYNIHVFIVDLEKTNKILSFCYDVKQESWISRDDCNTEIHEDFNFTNMFKH